MCMSSLSRTCRPEFLSSRLEYIRPFRDWDFTKKSFSKNNVESFLKGFRSTKICSIGPTDVKCELDEGKNKFSRSVVKRTKECIHI